MNCTFLRLKTNTEGVTVTEAKDFQSDLDSAKAYAYTAMADACVQKRPMDTVLVVDNAGNTVFKDSYVKPAETVTE